jgi:preprotein translocase subunit SecG
MAALKVLLIVIEVVSAILLIGIILIQKSKDEGLGLAFGSAMGETLFGSRAGNVLTKITVGLAVVFLINTLLIGYLMAGAAGTGSVTDRLPAQAASPVSAVPAELPISGIPETAPTPVGNAGGATAIPAQTPAPLAPVQAPATATP